MKKYRIDAYTIWEETGRITVHNYPIQRNRYPYFCKIYRQYKKNVLGWTFVEGPAIYFHDLTLDQRALVTIIGKAQDVLLSVQSKEEKKFKRIEE